MYVQCHSDLDLWHTNSRLNSKISIGHGKPRYQIRSSYVKKVLRNLVDKDFMSMVTVKSNCDLTIWPTDLTMYSGHLLTSDHDKPSYQVKWLSLLNFSRYWADTVFALNATVNLTFNLLISKIIEAIYWQLPIFLPSRMTVIHKLFKILSGHGFCI